MATGTEIQLANHHDRLETLEEIARKAGENLATQQAYQKTLFKQLETLGVSMEKQVEKLGTTLGDKIDGLSGSVDTMGHRVQALEEKMGDQGRRVNSLEQSRDGYDRFKAAAVTVATGLIIAGMTWGAAVIVQAAGR